MNDDGYFTTSNLMIKKMIVRDLGTKVSTYLVLAAKADSQGYVKRDLDEIAKLAGKSRRQVELDLARPEPKPGQVRRIVKQTRSQTL